MDDCASAQYPPITGELRAKLAEYEPTEDGYTLTTYPVGSTGYARLMELCDTIDAIHARLEAAYDRLRAERDSMAAALDRAEGEHDFAPESHYVMLPKDADGVPIHIGDMMVSKDGNLHKVDSLTRNPIGSDPEWFIGLVLLNDGVGVGSLVRYRPDTLRHYHAPTVEDVLREMLDAWGELPSNATNEAIVAEYAKRLTLAEGEDA